MNDKAVTARGLVVKFGDFKAVNDVSFEVAKGEIFGFLGANGAGKTTTIRVLCGLLIPSEGSVLVAGHDVRSNANDVKSSVGYMSQMFTLYRDMTIGENLNFTGYLRGMEDDKIKARIEELTDLIELEWPMKTLVRDLPTGVLQQVALIAATIHDPSIVFLDEPTAGVTPHARYKFWELIKTMAKLGKTVFVTTHYMEEAEQCGRVSLMRSGELIALGSPRELKQQNFPYPLFEITPPLNPPEGWRDATIKDGVADSVEIFGMHYHAETRSQQKFEHYFKSIKGFEFKKIEPSLEDVFIRLVEGQSR